MKKKFINGPSLRSRGPRKRTFMQKLFGIFTSFKKKEEVVEEPAEMSIFE
jgi:hypothetical protein